MRKNRSAGVSPASEPRQLLLGQQDLCRLEAGATFFLTTTEDTEIHTAGVGDLLNLCVSLLKLGAKLMHYNEMTEALDSRDRI